MSIRALDLFSGVGGSSWGARDAGVAVVAAFDHWTLAGESHRANFPETQFIQARLESLDTGALHRMLGSVDLILASPECTNHSPAKGNKPRCEASKNTAFQVIRFATEFDPRWIVIENVVNMRRWKRYAEFKDELKRLGYYLREQVINAADFGVAQSRKRLFLLADKLGIPRKVTSRTRIIRTVADVIDLDGPYRWSPLLTPTRAAATILRANRGLARVGKKRAVPARLLWIGRCRRLAAAGPTASHDNDH